MIAMSVDIVQALEIEGWMSESELMWLAERAAEHRLIVEIGSYLGRSTRAMLDNTDGILYAFDDWYGPRDVYLEKAEREALYRHFIVNNQEHIDSRKLRPVKGEYKLDLWNGLNPDMVFIDGSHEACDVARDIQRWWPRLQDSGLICGHDVDQVGVYPVVMELLPEAEVVSNTTIWYEVK